MSESSSILAPSAPARSPGWPSLLAWRFAFVYLVSYCAPWLVRPVPGGRWLIEHGYGPSADAMASWIARVLLGLPYELTPSTNNGSGDTTSDYIQVLAFAILAAIAACGWSLVSRRRHDPVLADRLRVYVRYAVGLTMIWYGAVKVFPTQFSQPDDLRLSVALGDMSPMGLLWTFMGYSPAYCVFTGAAEVLGGALLFWRRTTTLGGLVVIAVMVNVVALNYFYDVPVKLLSTHLLLMAVFVVLPDVHRLLDVFIRQRPTAPGPPRPPFRSARLERSKPWLKTALLTVALGCLTYRALDRWLTREESSDLQGAYDVESFRRDGVDSPASTSDRSRWRQVAINARGRIWVWRVDGSILRFGSERDEHEPTLKLDTNPLWPHPPDQPKEALLTFARPEPDRLVLDGSFNGERLTVSLRRRDMSRSLLVTRGFRWINEVPFNR